MHRYFYYSRITADEVKRNTDWLAANLREFGVQCVQIDDGWHLTRPVGTRDWTHTSPAQFPDGMADVAKHIKSRGFTPGLWIAPHGQKQSAGYQQSSRLVSNQTRRHFRFGNMGRQMVD